MELKNLNLTEKLEKNNNKIKDSELELKKEKIFSAFHYTVFILGVSSAVSVFGASLPLFGIFSAIAGGNLLLNKAHNDRKDKIFDEIRELKKDNELITSQLSSTDNKSIKDLYKDAKNLSTQKDKINHEMKNMNKKQLSNTLAAGFFLFTGILGVSIISLIGPNVFSVVGLLGSVYAATSYISDKVSAEQDKKILTDKLRIIDKQTKEIENKIDKIDSVEDKDIEQQKEEQIPERSYIEKIQDIKRDGRDVYLPDDLRLTINQAKELFGDEPLYFHQNGKTFEYTPQVQEDKQTLADKIKDFVQDKIEEHNNVIDFDLKEAR